MPDNLDLNTFYNHALQWKHQQEAVEKSKAEQLAEQVNRSWENIAKIIRAALPIEGMTIHETEPDQFRNMPEFIRWFEVDCAFNEKLKDKVEHGDGCLIEGVVRVRVQFDDAVSQWKLIKFLAFHGEIPTEFDNPYSAFLAVYPVLTADVDRVNFISRASSLEGVG